MIPFTYAIRGMREPERERLGPNVSFRGGAY